MTTDTDNSTYLCEDGRHAVKSFSGKARSHRREPCEECPWRKDAPVGAFPPDAFERSANTGHDLSTHVFACHMSGARKAAICAGFLLKGADDNLSVRLSIIRGDINPEDLRDSEIPLYDNYHQMAVANGVSPESPSLVQLKRK